MSDQTHRLNDKTENLSKTTTKKLSPEAPGVLPQINAVGVTIGNYELISEFSSRGGEADLYLCRDTREPEKDLIIKIYRGGHTPKKDILDELVQVSHPDIIDLKDWGMWNGRLYEVMEFAEGGCLADMMPFTEELLTSRIIPEIVQAIHFCHNNGIVHRDIKPSNIFYRDSNQTDIVLGDFGISSILRGEASVAMTSGSRTLAFSAPELFHGYVGIEVDYYALGITLLWLITGEDPFEGRSDQQIMFIHSTEKIELPPACSQRFQILLLGLLTKERKNRWGYNQIQRWLAGEDVPVMADIAPTRGFFYRLAPGIEARTIEELGRILYDNPDTGEEHVGRGLIEDTLKTFDQSLYMQIIKIRERAVNNHLAYLEIIYLLDPTLPFRLEGKAEAQDPAALANLIDSNDAMWQAGLIRLFDHSIPTWLRTTGFDHIVKQWLQQESNFSGHQNMGLEIFLHLLDPTLSVAQISINPDSMNIGKLETNLSRTIKFNIALKGRGFTTVQLALHERIDGIKCSKTSIELHNYGTASAEVDVDIDTGMMSSGQSYKTALSLNTSAGQHLVIPISFRTIFPRYQVLRQVGLWAGASALYFYTTRMAVTAFGHKTWLNLENGNSSFLSIYYIWERQVMTNFGTGAEYILLFAVLVGLPIGLLLTKVIKINFE